MATGKIFNNARIRASTTTCYALPASSMFYELTPFIQSVRIPQGSDTRDNTVMGMTYRSELRALKTATFELRALQQFSITAESVETSGGTARSIDALLNDLYNAEDKCIIAVRPDNAIRSSCNPEYWAPASLRTHTPMDGAVGDLLNTTITFGVQGDVVRSVSSS